MVLRFSSIFLLVALYSCGNQSVSSVDDQGSEEPLSGEVLYSNHCSSCHGADGKLGASGAKDLTQSKMNLEDVKSLLKTGRKAMPVMKEILETEENMTSVSEFVIEFQK